MGPVATLINPATGKCTCLPRFPFKAGTFDFRVKTKTYIGFDQEGLKFKVLGLSIGEEGEANTYQILSLDLDVESWKWREVNCPIEHSVPVICDTNSICINGNLYYTGRLPNREAAVIQFDLATESFSSSNPIPEKPRLGMDMYSWESGLLNVDGKVGVSVALPHHKSRLWVLEDPVNNKWSSIIVSTPLSILGPSTFVNRIIFQGFTRKGLSIFSQGQGPTLCLYYHNKETEEVHTDHIARAYMWQMFTFWNYVHTFMFA
ncbi:PREDICTED: putative F-box protein At1g53550 [Camelina sativa]|uniref:F-box protein At1g53550 n=1 Tax=Camelina sativa TaxID=90675 RepID=A0ABM0TTK2_CAMSA|nr:PREDICTED: putative F-box protein At1g53550 [Camelina sativa]